MVIEKETPAKDERIEALEQMMEMTTSYMSKVEAELKSKTKKLEASTQRINESLSFSRLLQNGISPSSDLLEKTFSGHFVLNKPKELIGGDLLWVRQKNGLTYVSVIDCTGHGIPGAMLTMGAYFSLNAVFENNDYTEPNELLQDFNVQFYNHFHMNSSVEDSMNHGLDISLLIIEEETQTVKFSGTHQSLVYFSQGLLKVHSGSRAYIGESELHLNTPVVINYKPEDRFYLYTDGVVDQFGGLKNKKLLPKRINRIIERTAGLNIEKQKEIIESVILDWKGKEEQTDDMLMLGFKI